MPLRTACVLLLGAIVSFAPAARAADDWNQWNAPAVSGVARGTTKIGWGVDWGHVPGDHTLRLGFDGEHLLRDHWSVIARVGLPVGGAWVAPALVGLRVNALPRFPVDPFLGAAGGVAWIRPGGLDARVDPMASVEAGLTVHYWAFFFFEAGARYDLVRYAASTGASDLSGLVVEGRTGVFF
jgi:hypothetical protein